MQIYRVGGAVRDRMLGLPIMDTDWVVTGSTPSEMLQSGYRQVGSDFPVFLHPKTGEEYALARTERKSGHGYSGFDVQTSPEVTLEEDLLRRDLTINAMAESEDGTIIDPYGGQKDLKAKLLRHVSPAFAEDPLRVLRVARFTARLAPLGFHIAPETRKLMEQLVQEGEMEHLVPERVWQETARALTAQAPGMYFTTLRQCGALKILIPELDALFGTPLAASPEQVTDTGRHTLKVLSLVAGASASLPTRFAALVHDIGNVAEADADIIRYGEKRFRELCARMKIPNDCADLARLAIAHHQHCHKLSRPSPDDLMQLLETCDAIRKPERFRNLLLVCEADYKSMQPDKNSSYPQKELALRGMQLIRKVEAGDFILKGFKGPEIGSAMRKARLKALESLFSPG